MIKRTAKQVMDDEIDRQCEFLGCNWAQKQRLLFIRTMLNVYFFINRDHLCRMFDISVPQASADFKLYKKINPGQLEYDPRKKHFFDPIPF